MNVPSVLILMSSYNGAKYIRQQIESILNQQGNFKVSLLVRDDGSTDQTTKILDEYREKKVLDWFSGENVGPAKSFLDALKCSGSYDYYAFADQDDVWFPDKILTGLTFLEGINKPALYFSNALLVDEHLHEYNATVYKNKPCLDFFTLCCAGGLLGCTMIFNPALASLVKENPLPKHVFMHDFYIAVLCKLCDGKIFYNTSATMFYRQHGKNVVGVKKDIVGKVKNKLKLVAKKSKISIADQSLALIPLASDPEKKKWLQKISQYRNNFLNRLLLASSLKMNVSLSLRMSIILGHR